MSKYSNLNWKPTYWTPGPDIFLGFSSEYVGSTGWLALIETELSSRTEENTDENGAFISPTGSDQTYRCSIYSWDRKAGEDTTYSVEENCTSNRVDSILDEVDVMAGPTYPEETTTTTVPTGPSPQWD